MALGEQVSIRLPQGAKARLQAVAAELSTRDEWAARGGAALSDVMRLALIKGLAELEAQHLPRSEGEDADTA